MPAFAITSDVQPKVVVICRTGSLREVIEEYLTNWYPDAEEITVKQVVGKDWGDS